MKKERKRSRLPVGRIVLLIILGFVIGLGGYTANARLILHDPMPMPFGIGQAVVLSGSMEPELSVGDLVFVRKESSYHPGDVVVYQDGNSLVIHRMISKNGDTVITQGDANNAADEPISLTDIRGKMVLSIPGIGNTMLFIASGPGIMILIASLACLLYYSHLKEQEEDEKELEEIRKEIEKEREGKL